MSELVMNPNKMEKLKVELKAELQSVAGEKQIVEESEIGKLPYLQAVIKEVMRIHPPGPLLLPRKAESDQVVKGYMIPKGTQILINAWAIGRDPSIWEDPDSFKPERFLDQKIDFKGQDYKLLPFGSGRRVCPGIPLANRILHMTVAALVHNFDWKLKDESTVEADHAGDHNNTLILLSSSKIVSFLSKNYILLPY